MHNFLSLQMSIIVYFEDSQNILGYIETYLTLLSYLTERGAILESLNKHKTYLECNVSSGKYTNGSRHYSVTAINIKPRCSYSMLKGLEFDIKEFPCFVFLLQQIDFEMKYKRNIRLRK